MDSLNAAKAWHSFNPGLSSAYYEEALEASNDDHDLNTNKGNYHLHQHTWDVQNGTNRKYNTTKLSTIWLHPASFRVDPIIKEVIYDLKKVICKLREVRSSFGCHLIPIFLKVLKRFIIICVPNALQITAILCSNQFLVHYPEERLVIYGQWKYFHCDGNFFINICKGNWYIHTLTHTYTRLWKLPEIELFLFQDAQKYFLGH